MNKEKGRNEVERSNKRALKQQMWEEWHLGPLQSKEGAKVEKIPREYGMSAHERRVRATQRKEEEKMRERERMKKEGLDLKAERRASPEYNVAVSLGCLEVR